MAPSPHRRLRLALLGLLGVVQTWSLSIVSPWAADRPPRLWLYDTLVYGGVALAFWGLAELGLLLHARRSTPPDQRPPALRPLLLPALAALLALGHHALMQTGPGYRLRARLSARVLAACTEPVYRDVRHRVGGFLIDTQRAPCGQAWLWLGRPFGGGTGINLALVHSPDAPPLTPHPAAYRFLQLTDAWWLAYQNAARAVAHPPAPAPVPGTTVPSHRAGMRFVEQPSPSATGFPSSD